MSMDYEAWHCAHEVEGGPKLFCQPEGCSKGECARDMAAVDEQDAHAEGLRAAEQ